MFLDEALQSLLVNFPVQYKVDPFEGPLGTPAKRQYRVYYCTMSNLLLIAQLLPTYPGSFLTSDLTPLEDPLACGLLTVFSMLGIRRSRTLPPYMLKKE